VNYPLPSQASPHRISPSPAFPLQHSPAFKASFAGRHGFRSNPFEGHTWTSPGRRGAFAVVALSVLRALSALVAEAQKPSESA
jgi:hypothetical protein